MAALLHKIFLCASTIHVAKAVVAEMDVFRDAACTVTNDEHPLVSFSQVSGDPTCWSVSGRSAYKSERRGHLTTVFVYDVDAGGTADCTGSRTGSDATFSNSIALAFFKDRACTKLPGTNTYGKLRAALPDGSYPTYPTGSDQSATMDVFSDKACSRKGQSEPFTFMQNSADAACWNIGLTTALKAIRKEGRTQLLYYSTNDGGKMDCTGESTALGYWDDAVAAAFFREKACTYFASTQLYGKLREALPAGSYPAYGSDDSLSKGDYILSIFTDSSCSKVYKDRYSMDFSQSPKDAACWNYGTQVGLKALRNKIGQTELFVYDTEKGGRLDCTGESSAITKIPDEEAYAFFKGQQCTSLPETSLYGKLNKALPDDSIPEYDAKSALLFLVNGAQDMFSFMSAVTISACICALVVVP